MPTDNDLLPLTPKEAALWAQHAATMVLRFHFADNKEYRPLAYTLAKSVSALARYAGIAHDPTPEIAKVMQLERSGDLHTLTYGRNNPVLLSAACRNPLMMTLTEMAKQYALPLSRLQRLRAYARERSARHAKALGLPPESIGPGPRGRPLAALPMDLSGVYFHELQSFDALIRDHPFMLAHAYAWARREHAKVLRQHNHAVCPFTRLTVSQLEGEFCQRRDEHGDPVDRHGRRDHYLLVAYEMTWERTRIGVRGLVRDDGTVDTHVEVWPVRLFREKIDARMRQLGRAPIHKRPDGFYRAAELEPVPATAEPMPPVPVALPPSQATRYMAGLDETIDPLLPAPEGMPPTRSEPEPEPEPDALADIEGFLDALDVDVDEAVEENPV